MSRGLTLEQMEFLVSKGISAEEMVAFAKMGSAKSKGAERTARWRAKKAGNVTNSVTRDVTCDASPPPNDIYSNPPDSLSAKADCPSLADRVVEAWNAGPRANGARKATALDANRRKWLSLRVRDHGEAAVFAAIANIGASPFHCGTNDRGWKANIGWLLKSPEKFLSALEMEDDAKPPPNDLLARAAQYAKPLDRIAA
jgi:hypothetical protein